HAAERRARRKRPMRTHSQNTVLRPVEDAPQEETAAGKPPESPRLVRLNDDLAGPSQGMEAMGRLAGGIAHVFNNLLTAMACETELALLRLAPDDPARKHLREIERVGERGAALARQLLAFSGRQVLQPRLVQLNNLLTDLDDELRRVLGDGIELRMDLDPDLERPRRDAAGRPGLPGDPHHRSAARQPDPPAALQPRTLRAAQGGRHRSGDGRVG